MPTARYRYRFYPTDEQAQQLACQFGCSRYVYNWALSMKRDAFKECGEKISYAETDKRLTGLKKDESKAWLREVSSVPLKQSLRHLDKAYQAFFQGRSKYPSFKKKNGRQSATYGGNAFSLKGTCTDGWPTIKLAKQSEPLNIRWSRPLPSRPSSLTVMKEPDGRYYITFVVEVSPQPLPKTKAAVGIDLGIKDVVVTSDGWRSGNPKHMRRSKEKLAKLDRRLARKQKGSANRTKARVRVAKLHTKIANQRKDFLHQMTTRLVRRYDVIVAESLAVKNMVKNRSLAGAISDCGWGTTTQMLSYKSEWYGKSFVQLDRFFPGSKTCHKCNHVAESMPLDVREWTCEGCGAEHDRDENAAKNHLAAGLAATAYGGEGRPALASVSGALPDEVGISLC